MLERITCVPPIRPLTRAAFAMYEYAGELSISLRCDPQCFKPVDCQTLLDEFAARVTQTARERA